MTEAITVSIVNISYLSVFIAKRSYAMARRAVTWAQQGKADRRACSMKSSGVCPQRLFSLTMLHSNAEITQARWVKGWCLGIEHFILWGRSTGNSVCKVQEQCKSKNQICFLTNTCIFIGRCVCLLTLGQISLSPYVCYHLHAPKW